MVLPSAFVETWLLAREHGWPLGDFCDLVKKCTGVEAAGARPQERYLYYCKTVFADEDILSLEKAIVKAPPVVSSGCITAERLATNATVVSQATALSLADDAQVRERGGKGSRCWVALLVVVVTAGITLTLTASDVYPRGALGGDMTYISPLAFLAVFLLLGVVVRARFRILQYLYIPSSLIGGIIGLVYFQTHRAIFDAAGYTNGTNAVDHVHDVWTPFVVTGLNVIFAGLFLGQTIPSFRRIWDICCVQFVYGQILAWGQYAVGMSIGTIFGYHVGEPHQSTFGTVLPVGFEGGHGVGVSIRDIFIKNGWDDGADYCAVASTFGFFGGLTLGVGLINWYRRFKVRAKPPPKIDLLRPLMSDEDGATLHGTDRSDGFTDPFEKQRELELQQKEARRELRATFVPHDRAKSAGKAIVQSVSVGLLSYHVALLFAAVAFGYGCKTVLILLDNMSTRDEEETGLFETVPTFPFAMLGGIVIMKILETTGNADKLDSGVLGHLTDIALDIIVVGSTAGIRIAKISSGLLAFGLLMLAGLAFQVFMVLFVAERFFATHWFERAIVEFGQSTGVTATGLLLLKLVDSESHVVVLNAFALKQLLHEPFMGGGLWTSAAVPLTAAIGPWSVCAISTVVVVGYAIMYKFYADPKQRREVASLVEARVGDV